MTSEKFTPELVMGRLRAAAETLNALPPPDRPELAQSDWRSFWRGWDDAVQAEEGRFRRDARGRIIHGNDQYRTPLTHWHPSFLRPPPPPAGAIDEAYRTVLWSRFLNGDRRLLLALWLTLAEGLGVTETARVMSRRLKMKPPSRASVRRWRDLAVRLIVEGLRAETLPPNQRLRVKLRAALSLAATSRS